MKNKTKKEYNQIKVIILYFIKYYSFSLYNLI